MPVDETEVTYARSASVETKLKFTINEFETKTCQHGWENLYYCIGHYIRIYDVDPVNQQFGSQFVKHLFTKKYFAHKHNIPKGFYWCKNLNFWERKKRGGQECGSQNGPLNTGKGYHWIYRRQQWKYESDSNSSHVVEHFDIDLLASKYVSQLKHLHHNMHVYPKT